MTIGQCDIIRWIQTEIPNATTEIIGDSVVRATDQEGKQTDYSMNIFGDILKVEEGKTAIIAVSDLPHSLDRLPMYARPTAWTRKEGR